MDNRINYSTFLAFLIVFTSFMTGCGDEEVRTQITEEVQREKDSIAIAEYINEKGIDPATLDTTAAGVIYQIIEKGSGDTIKYNDIVSLFLSLKLTDGTLLWTNIDTVLLNHDLFDSTEVVNSLIITHTQTGWTLTENNFLGLQGFVGLREGMSAVLSNMNVGGKAMFITPSMLSLRTGSRSYPNQEVFVFHIYPTKTR